LHQIRPPANLCDLEKPDIGFARKPIPPQTSAKSRAERAGAGLQRVCQSTGQTRLCYDGRDNARGRIGRPG